MKTEQETLAMIELYLPLPVREALQGTDRKNQIEEIRIRVNQPVQLVLPDGEKMLPVSGITEAECEEMILRMCEYSLPAREEEFRQGFFTLPGGVRVGICGRAVLREGIFIRVADVTSVNIRIPREQIAMAEELVSRLTVCSEDMPSVLLFSPPGLGKTTMLRDVARQLAGDRYRRKVCIIDERMEIAGSTRGAPQFDVGKRTDVFCGCPKAVGMRMAVRSLAPDVLITDEIGAAEDAAAICDAAKCGVAVWASAHGSSFNELRQRKTLMEIFRNRVFVYYVRLGKSHGIGTVEEIIDGNGRQMAVNAT